MVRFFAVVAAPLRPCEPDLRARALALRTCVPDLPARACLAPFAVLAVLKHAAAGVLQEPLLERIALAPHRLADRQAVDRDDVLYDVAARSLS